MVWDLLDPKPDGATLENKSTKAESSARSTQSGTVEAYECDYEHNCTPLYKKIENAIEEVEWAPIIKFLDTGYWPGSMFADDLSPKQQAMTWVTRFDLKDNTRVRWSQLPLHLAIVCGAPFSVIGRLIELYPQAVRCTDDQRMLPIHLALRYDALDDTIAYLLMQFPESVNAKGKDGRTPVQCALRAESKVRGKILEIFITKTKTKTKNKLAAISEAGGVDKDKEIELLKAQLEAKSLALQNALSKFTMLSAVKNEVEDDLSQKIDEAEKSKAAVRKESSEQIDSIKDQKLVEEIVLQMKIDDLEKDKKEKEEARLKAKEEEASLRQELESVTKAVASASSPEELAQIKEEIQSLNQSRLEQDKHQVQEQIESLRVDLEKSKSELSGKADPELKSMANTAEKLSDDIKSVRTSNDVTSLRSKAESLGKKMKERNDASRTMIELTALRIAMEADLKNSDGKSEEELASLQRTLHSMEGFERKSTEELATLKAELESLRKDSKKKELVLKTQKDLEELKEALESRLKEADDASQQEITKAMSMVDEIGTELVDRRSTDELLAIKKQVDAHKEEMKEKEQVSNLRVEIEVLKEVLDAESKKTSDKTRQELAELKKALKSVKSLATKNASELSAEKAELESLKSKIDRRTEMTKSQKELSEMTKLLEEHEKEWDGANKDGISAMKTAVGDLSARHTKLSSEDDIHELRSELKSLREDVELATKATKVKQDLNTLQETLEDALKASAGHTADELVAMKKAVDSISVELDIKNTSQWELIEAELTALKDDLKTKEAGQSLLQKEIEELRKQVPIKGKKRRGWKKLFFPSNSRSRRARPATSLISSMWADTVDVDADGDVRTILPPSVPADNESGTNSKTTAPTPAEHTDEETDEDRPTQAEEVSVRSKKSGHSSTKSAKSGKSSTKSAKSGKSSRSSKSTKSLKSSKSAKSSKTNTSSPSTSGRSKAPTVTSAVDPKTGGIELKPIPTHE